jgi:hypothetical protein
MFEGLMGLLHLIVAIWAIFNIVGSSASTLGKVLWTLFVLIFPVVGLIVWFFAGPKSSARIA